MGGLRLANNPKSRYKHGLHTLNGVRFCIWKSANAQSYGVTVHK